MVATLPSFVGAAGHGMGVVVVVIAVVTSCAAGATAVLRLHIPGAPAGARPVAAPGARLPAPLSAGWPPGWLSPAVRRHCPPVPTRRAPAATGRRRSRGPARPAPASAPPCVCVGACVRG